MGAGWLSQIRGRVDRAGLVKGGQMVRSAQEMFSLLGSSDGFFRGWSADLMMRSPTTSNQIFQITLTTNIINKEEIDLLSSLSEEFDFNYYIDTSQPQTIIRCFSKSEKVI